MVLRHSNTVLPSRRKIRLRHRETGAFLHAFGSGTTHDPVWAWSGTRHQAATCASRARARGEDWPFVIDDMDEDAAPFVSTLDRLAR